MKPGDGSPDKGLSEDYLRAHTVGELEPLPQLIRIENYDPEWPLRFETEAVRIESVMGDRALRVEHVGSTAVPGLAAKPVIDIVLEVADSADESAYSEDLQAAGYRLKIREPDWNEHRMFTTSESDVNLHVFSAGCPEINRMLVFRDWLRANDEDRDLYARTKLALAQKQWKYTQNYADAKTDVVAEIMARAQRARADSAARPAS